MKILRNEKGQVLPLVMIAVAFGALLITPFLNLTGTSLLGARNYQQTLDAQYAADSGAEHAIWRLKYEDLILAKKGDQATYTLGENINGLQVDITVEKTAQHTYSIISTACSSTLDVSADVNLGTVHINTWQFE